MASIIKELPDRIKEKYINKEFSHDCYEVIGLGYLVIRYLMLNVDYGYEEQLKYGLNNKVAHFVTLVPYHGVDLDLTPESN